MERNVITDTIEWLSFRYGILMALVLAGFFFLMKAFGLEHNLELRAFNLIILASFILMAVQDFKKRKSGKLSYLKGLMLGNIDYNHRNCKLCHHGCFLRISC